MLTLTELKGRQIAPRKKRYDKDEMDEFLELVYSNYGEAYALNDEIKDLKKKIKTLSDGIQYYHSIETTLQQALILAEKTSKETKDAAILKAEAIEKEALVKANSIISEAEQEYSSIKQQCIHLVQQFNQYKLQLKQAASAQIELIESDVFDIYSPELNSLYKNETKTIEATNDIIIDEVEVKEPVQVKAEEPVEVKVEKVVEQPVKVEKATKTVEVKVNNNIEPVIEEQLNFTFDEISASVEPVIDDKRSAVNKIEDVMLLDEPAEAITFEPLEAKVIEPKDATMTEPISYKNIVETPVTPVKDGNKVHSLDDLLRDLNMSSKKDDSSSDNDPFEFLGSIEDF